MKLFKTPVKLGPVAACVVALSLGAMALPVQTKTTKAHEKPDWGDRIIPGSQLTVLELARQIIPDIKSDPDKLNSFKARDLSAVRLLDGVIETGMELDLEPDGECEMGEPDYFWMKEGGQRLLLLLLQVDGAKSGVVLGLFKVSPEVGLLDAVTIAQDMHVSVDTESLWAIHSQHQAFVVESWHDNSSESYDTYTFVSIVAGKLRAIADSTPPYGFTEYSPARQRLCKTATTPKFQFVQSSGRKYYDLLIRETTLKVCHRESEEWSWKTGIVSQKVSRQLLRWNPRVKRYRKPTARG